MEAVEFTDPCMPNVSVVLTCRNHKIFDSGQMFKAIEMALEYFRIPLTIDMHISIKHDREESSNGTHCYLKGLDCHNIEINSKGRQNQNFWCTLFHEMAHMKQYYYKEIYFLRNNAVKVWKPAGERPRYFDGSASYKLTKTHYFEYIRLPWESDADRHAIALLEIARQSGFKISKWYIWLRRKSMQEIFGWNPIEIAINPILHFLVHSISAGLSYYLTGEFNVVLKFLTMLSFVVVCIFWWMFNRRKNIELRICSITHEFYFDGTQKLFSEAK